MQSKIQVPRGMHDILGNKFISLFDIMKDIALNYGFTYIETPIIESRNLFERPLGPTSDIVEKEMFSLSSKEYVLRPEGTAPVVRAYIENGLFSLPQPQKLFYFGPMLRKERPQKSRFREHHQFGLEILGSESPIYDAFIVNVLWEIFKVLKIEVIFFVNSIGCQDCRKIIKEKIKNYYKPYLNKVCDDCKRRYKVNPLRLLDCKVDVEIAESAPQIIDFLCEQCQEKFEEFLEILDKIEIPYEIKNNIVRGLDYYNNTVFEVFSEKESLALGGGGRYDNLASFFTKRKVPGVGAALGVERILELWNNYKEEKKVIGVVRIGEVNKFFFEVINLLARGGFRIIESFGKENIKQQLEFLNSLNVRYHIFIGEVESKEEQVVFKDFKTGIYEKIHIKNLIKELTKRVK